MAESAYQALDSLGSAITRKVSFQGSKISSSGISLTTARKGRSSSPECWQLPFTLMTPMATRWNLLQHYLMNPGRKLELFHGKNEKN